MRVQAGISSKLVQMSVSYLFPVPCSLFPVPFFGNCQLSIFTFRPVIPVFSTKNSQPEEATQAKPMQVGLKPLILC